MLPLLLWIHRRNEIENLFFLFQTKQQSIKFSIEASLVVTETPRDGAIQGTKAIALPRSPRRRWHAEGQRHYPCFEALRVGMIRSTKAETLQKSRTTINQEYFDRLKIVVLHVIYLRTPMLSI